MTETKADIAAPAALIEQDKKADRLLIAVASAAPAVPRRNER
jgi:hypothetical protein